MSERRKVRFFGAGHSDSLASVTKCPTFELEKNVAQDSVIMCILNLLHSTA